MLTSPNEIVPLQIGRGAMGSSSPFCRFQVVLPPFTQPIHGGDKPVDAVDSVSPRRLQSSVKLLEAVSGVDAERAEAGAAATAKIVARDALELGERLAERLPEHARRQVGIDVGSTHRLRDDLDLRPEEHTSELQ